MLIGIVAFCLLLLLSDHFKGDIFTLTLRAEGSTNETVFYFSDFPSPCSVVLVVGRALSVVPKRDHGGHLYRDSVGQRVGDDVFGT